MRKSILADKSLLELTLRESTNYAVALGKLGLTGTSGNYKTLVKYIKEYDIDFIPNKKRPEKIKKIYSDKQCFKIDSTIARQHVKSRIIKNNLIDYKCIECGINGEWNNKKLVLQLEHKNGINNDNRIENLAFICPNCHSQTETYAAKNKIRVSQGG